MDLAIIGATGSCGRQVAAQIAQRGFLPDDAVMHLIGHAGGAHESELWGLRADIRDAFADIAPQIEVGTDVAETSANVVVMMAGATVTRLTDDRAALAETNRRIFSDVAERISIMDSSPSVVVQSNPVEFALDLLSSSVERKRLIGAAAWSDSLRFRRELAADLAVTRPMVQAQMWGQHGDHLVPIWSGVRVQGVSEQRLADVIGAAREGRDMTDLPEEIAESRTRMLGMVNDGEIEAAYRFIEALPPDLRAAIKPFFTHFTAGHTTELATAHAVVDIVEFMSREVGRVIPAQVLLEGETWGVQGPLAVPVMVDQWGWSQTVDESIADDETAALVSAAIAVRQANESMKG